MFHVLYDMVLRPQLYIAHGRQRDRAITCARIRFKKKKKTIFLTPREEGRRLLHCSLLNRPPSATSEGLIGCRKIRFKRLVLALQNTCAWQTYGHTWPQRWAILTRKPIDTIYYATGGKDKWRGYGTKRSRAIRTVRFKKKNRFSNDLGKYKRFLSCICFRPTVCARFRSIFFGEFDILTSVHRIWTFNYL